MIRKHICAFLFFSIAFSLWAGPAVLIIKNPSAVKIDENLLRDRFQIAQDFFSKEIEPLTRPITIVISGNDCLRTGYQYTREKVIFCPNDKVQNMGLESVDVFNHELFHAFICQIRPSFCLNDLRTDIHEGMADYFSYLLNPDDFFGEGYYKDGPYIRSYFSSWRAGLVTGSHERGSVIAYELIRTREKLRNALNLFEGNLTSEEVAVIVEGAPKSHLNRYRLAENETMLLTFEFDITTRVDRVEWNVPHGVLVKRLSAKSFSIGISSVITGSKGQAVFLSPEGIELGRKSFYFGKK